jgi:hypothetical protein
LAYAWTIEGAGLNEVATAYEMSLERSPIVSLLAEDLRELAALATSPADHLNIPPAE